MTVWAEKEKCTCLKLSKKLLELELNESQLIVSKDILQKNLDFSVSRKASVPEAY